MSRPKASLQPAVDCLESLCDLVFGVLVEVSIDVHRDSNARMAEVLTYESGVGAGGDEHRGAGVPHVVDSQSLLTDLRHCRVPGTPPEVRSTQRSPTCGEDEALRAGVRETPDVVPEHVGNERRDRRVNPIWSKIK